MANQNINIQINAAVESAEAARSLGQLRRSLIDIQNLQAEIGDESSVEFRRLQTAAQGATARLAGTREAIGDIQDRVRTLDGSPVERMGNSFQLLREGIMNIDLDKIKIGFEGIKTALVSNPIFLVAAAIAAAAAAITAILAGLGLLKPLIDGVGKAFKAVSDEFKRFTDFLGLTANQEEARMKQIMDAYEKASIVMAKYNQALKAGFDIAKGATEEEIAMVEKRMGVRAGELQKYRTDAQLRVKITEDELRKNGEALQAANAQKESADRKNIQLSAEFYQNLEKLRAKDRELDNANRAAYAQRDIDEIRKKEELNNKFLRFRIGTMNDGLAKYKATLELERAAEIKAIEETIKDIEAQSGKYEEAQKLKAQVNAFYNKQIADYAAGLSKERAKQELDDLDKNLKLQLLMTEENSDEQLKVIEKYQKDRIELQKKYKDQLGLDVTDIKIAELEALDAVKTARKNYYTEDLNDWIAAEENKIALLEENSPQRLAAEASYLQAKLKKYEENYKNLEMSETEYQKVRAEISKEYDNIIQKQTEQATERRIAVVGLISTNIINDARVKLEEAFEAINVSFSVEPYAERLKFIQKFADGFKDVNQIQKEFNISQEEALKIFGLIIASQQASLKQSADRATLDAEAEQKLLDAEKRRFERLSDKTPYDNLKEISNNIIAYEKSVREYRYNAEIKNMEANLQAFIALENQKLAEVLLNLKKIEDATIAANEAQKQKLIDMGVEAKDAEFMAALERERIIKEFQLRREFLTDEFNKNMLNHEEIHQAQMQAALRKFNEDEIQETKNQTDKLKEEYRRRRDNAISATADMTKGIQSIMGIFYTASIKAANGDAKRIAQLKEEQFNIEKGFNIATAVINGIQSILAITATPDPTGGIINGIRIAAQVALNAASIAAIWAQEFDAGGSTPPPSGGGGGTPGGAVGGVTSPQIPDVARFQAGQFYGLGEMQLANQNQMGPQRVYVLETDITAVQQKVNVIEQRATFN